MNREVAKIFSKVVLAENTIKIKLLGDSITHGVGGTGFDMNGEHIVGEFYRSPDSYCWANSFKKHMEDNYNCTVTNNACTGTRIDFVIENFDTLVAPDDDIVICTIGTNDRHQYYVDAPMHTREEHMKIFYDNVIELNDRFAKRGRDYILVANIPSSAENEAGTDEYARLFHMSDVNDIYMKVATEYGFPFISMYELFLEYCDARNIDYSTLLCDGLHPNDAGYDVMYKLLLHETGLGRNIM